MPLASKRPRIEFTYRGRSCIAVVRDRGPYVGGRVFDLGPGTARALGFSGVGSVNYRILGR
jgi:rare lipoprotein A (peptidoglycan hydrolase)